MLLLQQLVTVFAHYTGGEIGLTIPDVMSIDDTNNYYIALAFMAVSGAILFGLSRSALGLILQACGQDRITAQALGFNVAKHKLAAFCVSALFSGLAGRDAGVLPRHGVAGHGDRHRGRRAGDHRGRAGRPQDDPRRRAGGGVPDRRGRDSAAARPAQHLRGVGSGAAGDSVRPVRSSRARAEDKVVNVDYQPGAKPCGAGRPPGLLEVSGLTKRFGGLVAVKNMSLSIAPGEILGLIGPNGSGKSTVMKLIMGIERPNAGQVRIDGVDVAGWPSHRIARQGRRAGVPAFPPDAPPDGAGEHQARPAAGRAAQGLRRPGG
ncbi:MAG: ATP-binding cassette domain-containing protein [Acetobacteraceae bacterium]